MIDQLDTNSLITGWKRSRAKNPNLHEYIDNVLEIRIAESMRTWDDYLTEEEYINICKGRVFN